MYYFITKKLFWLLNNIKVLTIINTSRVRVRKHIIHAIRTTNLVTCQKSLRLCGHRYPQFISTNCTRLLVRNYRSWQNVEAHVEFTNQFHNLNLRKNAFFAFLKVYCVIPTCILTFNGVSFTIMLFATLCIMLEVRHLICAACCVRASDQMKKYNSTTVARRQHHFPGSQKDWNKYGQLKCWCKICKCAGPETRRVFI